VKNSNRARLHRALHQLQSTAVWNVEPAALDQWIAGMRGAIELGEVSEASLAAIFGRRNEDPGLQMAGDVAVLSIVGTIRRSEDIYTRYGLATSLSAFQANFQAALDDPKVRGILLSVDSPGGDAIGNDEAARQVYDARGRKPILTFARGLIASAAYYVGSAADKIFVTPSTLVGSIGSMTVHEAWKPTDTAYTVVRHGANKAAASPYETLSDAGRAELQRLVGAYGRQFEAAVARNRGVSLETVDSQFGQGSTFVGAEAVSHGLVDGVVQSIDDVLAMFPRGASQATSRPSLNAATVAAGAVSPALLAEDTPVVNGPAVTPAVGATLPNLTKHESTIAAGASAASQTRSSTMNPKIKAALWARGLINALDVADDVCQVALGAFFSATHRAVPSEEAKIIAALNGTEVLAIAAVAAPLQAGTVAGAGANPVQAAHDREQAEARAQEGARRERERVKQIRERGKVLQVSQEQIDNALDSDKSLDEIVNGWFAAKAAAEKPIARPLDTYEMTESGQTAFLRDATDALSIRLGLKCDKPSPTAKRWGQAGVPLSFLARESLAILGDRRPAFESQEDVAKRALEMEMNGGHAILNEEGTAYNRPASFPNLLSSIANKMLDDGLGRANATYQQWTGRTAGDLPDMKSAPSVAKSSAYVLDEVPDGKDYQEFAVAEEILSAIQVRRYGNAFGWTPALVANDDLGAFVEAMLGLGEAAELTVNNLCLGVLTGNAYLLDGYQLIDDTNHGNQVVSGQGGAPSAAQWTKMKLKIQGQRPVGGKGYIREPLKVALVPPALNEGALQTFAAFGAIPEVKNPATDANINIYRGLATVVEEPELQAFSSTKWWGFADPTRAPAIVRGYFRGWGPGGRRETWWDPSCQTQWVAMEIRVGVAAKQYRTVVENYGA